jgi:hypothetical protein
MSTPTDQQITERLARFMGWKPEVRKKYAGEPNCKGWGKNQHLHLGDKDREFSIWTPEVNLDSRDALQPVLEKLNEEQADQLLEEIAETMERRVEGKSDGMGFIAVITLPPRTLAAALYEVIGEI